MPLTLLRLDEAHRSAVIEIGDNNPGEVGQLVAIARPTVGLITNAGASISKASVIWMAWRAPRARWSRASRLRQSPYQC